MLRTVHLLVVIEMEDDDDRTVVEVRADVERELSTGLAVGGSVLTVAHDDNGAAPWSVDPVGRQRIEDATRERTAYLAAASRALMRRDPALEPYLSPICPECDQVPEQEDGIHTVLGSAVVIGCEGYWVINPNVVAVPSPNWQPRDLTQILHPAPQPRTGTSATDPLSDPTTTDSEEIK
jgi:hypothetical protein